MPAGSVSETSDRVAGWTRRRGDGARPPVATVSRGDDGCGVGRYANRWCLDQQGSRCVATGERIGRWCRLREVRRSVALGILVRRWTGTINATTSSSVEVKVVRHTRPMSSRGAIAHSGRKSRNESRRAARLGRVGHGSLSGYAFDLHSGEWRNRQTRWLQVPVIARSWGFKSPLPPRNRAVPRCIGPVWAVTSLPVVALLDP